MSVKGLHVRFYSNRYSFQRRIGLTFIENLWRLVKMKKTKALPAGDPSELGFAPERLDRISNMVEAARRGNARGTSGQGGALTRQRQA